MKSPKKNIFSAITFAALVVSATSNADELICSLDVWNSKGIVTIRNLKDSPNDALGSTEIEKGSRHAVSEQGMDFVAFLHREKIERLEAHREGIELIYTASDRDLNSYSLGMQLKREVVHEVWHSNSTPYAVPTFHSDDVVEYIGPVRIQSKQFNYSGKATCTWFGGDSGEVGN